MEKKCKFSLIICILLIFALMINAGKNLVKTYFYGDYHFNTEYVSSECIENFYIVKKWDSIKTVFKKLNKPFRKENVKFLSIVYYSNPTIPEKYKNQKGFLYRWPFIIYFDEKGKMIDYVDIKKAIDGMYFQKIKKLNKKRILKLFGTPDFLETIHDYTILYYSKQKDGIVTGKYGDYIIKNVILNDKNEVVHIVDSASKMGDYKSIIKNMGYY